MLGSDDDTVARPRVYREVLAIGGLGGFGQLTWAPARLRLELRERDVALRGRCMETETQIHIQR